MLGGKSHSLCIRGWITVHSLVTQIAHQAGNEDERRPGKGAFRIFRRQFVLLGFRQRDACTACDLRRPAET